MSYNKNILVLGGTGFIGSALVGHLRTNPENRIHLLVHRNIPYKKLEDFNIFAGSLANFDPYWLIRYPPDVIFHMARPAGSYKISRRLAAHQARKANQRLINIIKGVPKPPPVIYVSGSLMYGPQSPDSSADERSALKPVSYASYYIKGEKPWIMAQKEGVLDVRFARPAWILGPSSWFREFYWKHYKQSGKVPCFGDGSQLMSLVNLEDCARMIAKLSLSGSKGQNLNIFSGKQITQSYFSHSIARQLKTQVQNISWEQLRRKYGKTAATALQASIPLSTLYPEIQEQSGILYPDADAMIGRTLELLKNE